MKKILAIALAAMMALTLVACGGSKSAANNTKSTEKDASSIITARTDEAPLSDAEAWYGNHTYTVQEYLDLAPRIMVMAKPGWVDKKFGVDSIYIIANDTITEKQTVPSSSIKSLAEMGKYSGKEWEQYLLGRKKITMGELARMSEDDLWAYVSVLETVSEEPLSLHSFTDRSGNVIIGEDINDLLNFDNYMDHPQMGYMNFPIYSKYYIGFAIVSPRERMGYYFLSDEDIMLQMDDWNSPGVGID